VLQRKQNREGRRYWRPFFVVLSFPLSLSFFAALTLMSSGPAYAAMRGYIVTDFDTIRVEAPVRIVVSTGGGAKGMGEGDRESLDRVNLSVSGGTMTVRMTKRPDISFEDGMAQAPTLYLSTGQLRRANVIGGGLLKITEIAGVEAELSMSGNGEMIVENANVEQLKLYVGGGGRLTISGKARDVRASVNGPGALQATGLAANNASITNDGPGLIRMTVNGSAKVVSTGSGDTIVEGKPACAITRRGIGRIQCGSSAP